MRTTLYRILKISHPAKLTTNKLQLVNSNGLITQLDQVAEYQSLEAVKNFLKVDKLNRKTNGLKLTRPIVHSNKHYIVVKLGA